MELSISQCALTNAPYKTKLKPNKLKTKLDYNDLGVQLVPTLKWTIQQSATLHKFKTKANLLIQSPTTIPQNLHIVNNVICPGTEYTFCVAPFSIPRIKKPNYTTIQLIEIYKPPTSHLLTQHYI